jgi:hypothetical protein
MEYELFYDDEELVFFPSDIMKKEADCKTIPFIVKFTDEK